MKSSEKWCHFCKIIFQPLFYRLSASLLAYKWPTFYQSFIYSKTFIELASFLKQNLALLQKTATSNERFATLHKSLPTEKMHNFSWVFVNNQTKYNLYRTTNQYMKRKTSHFEPSEVPVFYAKIMSKFTRRLNKSQSFNIWNQGVT